MPSARPDTIVTPASDNDCANASAFALPWVVALRLPTMARAGRDNSDGLPRT
jgi:hypothetical protein